MPSSRVVTGKSVGATVRGESQSFWALGCAVEDGGDSDGHGTVLYPQVDVDGLVRVAVDDGHRCVPGRLVEGGGDVDDRDVAAACRLHLGCPEGNAKGVAGGGVSQHPERPVDALHEEAIGAGEDRCDDVDDLRNAGDLDDVSVADERVEVLRAHERVLEVVVLLEQVGCLLEVPSGGHLAVPDVPLVERDVHPVEGALEGAARGRSARGTR